MLAVDNSSFPDWFELHYVHAWYKTKLVKFITNWQIYELKLDQYASFRSTVSSLSNAHNQCGIMRMEQQHQNLRI